MPQGEKRAIITEREALYNGQRGGGTVFMEDSYQALNDILVVLFNDIMDIEQDAIITGEFRNL